MYKRTMSPIISTHAKTGFLMETSDRVISIYIMHPNGAAGTGKMPGAGANGARSQKKVEA